MYFRVIDGGRCFLQIFAIYQTTRRHIPEDGELHTCMCCKHYAKAHGRRLRWPIFKYDHIILKDEHIILKLQMPKLSSKRQYCP